MLKFFPAWEHGFLREKVLPAAWERQIAEMAPLRTVFTCVPTHFNLWANPHIDLHKYELDNQYSKCIKMYQQYSNKII